jgi:hypothetical protein
MASTQLKLRQLIQDGASTDDVIIWDGSEWVAGPLSSLINLVEGQGRDNAMTSLVGKLCSTINPELWLKETYSIFSPLPICL